MDYIRDGRYFRAKKKFQIELITRVISDVCEYASKDSK